MKILFLSLDRDLLKADQSSSVIQRQLSYAQSLKKMLYLIYSPAKYQLSDKALQDNLIIQSSGGKNSLKAFKQMYKIARSILEKEEYDLIVAQDPFITGIIGYLLKKKFNIALNIDLHGDFFYNKEFLKERFYNIFLVRLSKFLVKRADSLRVVNKEIKDKLIKIGVKKKNIKIVPLPVNLEQFENFQQQKLDKLKNNYQNNFIILFVGILKIEKNLNFFLNILAETIKNQPHLKFLIIGNGPKRKEWESLSTSLGLQETVEFIGEVGQDDLSNYYHLADLLVLPSTSESLGRVIIEAAMAKIPVLASRTLGANSLISHQQTGLLFEIDNQKDCQDKLIQLITDSELRQGLGSALYLDIKQRFNYHENLEKILNCWQEAVNN